MNEKNKRIEWIDIFKGLAIILVVIGHSTGQFNGYIYQFHVAAFFFISGWVAKFDNTNLFKDLYKKIMTLLLPLITAIFLFGIITEIMNYCGIYQYFWDDGTFLGISKLMKNFFSNGSLINLLGATWFLIVLFLSSLLSHLLYYITLKNKYFFCMVSIMIYILGYYRLSAAHTLPFGADIVPIAQCYYSIGYILKSALPDISLKKRHNGIAKSLLLLSITTLIMYLMKKNLSALCLMNLSDRQMTSLGWNTLAVINGILWLYSLSQFFCLISWDIIKNGLIKIGKNTMGIMLFHFLLFRLCALLLFLLGIAKIDELKNLVPSTEIGNNFWLFYTTIAIVGSVYIWKLLTKLPILKQLLGSDSQFINTLLDTWPIKKIRILMQRLTIHFAHITQNLKYKSNIVPCFIGLCVIAFSSWYIFSKFIITKEITGPVQIQFPYNGNLVSFKNGWLDQAQDENYRWVQKESIFEIPLSTQTTIHFSGYIPTESDAFHINIYLNDILISEANINNEQELSLDATISNALKDGVDVFKIVFDGERIPTPTDEDQRIFSAMFTSIEIH